jgi:putative transposase
VSTEEKLHPGHRSIRLKGRDYSAPGIYFVTICVEARRCIFGRINENQTELSGLGSIVREIWNAIPRHFAHVNLHGFVIMPNHVHGLIEIACQDGAQHAAPLQEASAAIPGRPQVKAGSLSAIVRSFKAAVTLRARKELGWPGEIWQRNYFERVVRDGQEFSDAARYIAENPMLWGLDKENPEAKGTPRPEFVGAQHAAPLLGKISR